MGDLEVGQNLWKVFPEVPFVVQETDFVQILFVFGQRFFVDGLDVELERAFDEVLEVAGEGFFGLFENEEPDGPGDGHEEQVQYGRAVLVLKSGRCEELSIIVLGFGAFGFGVGLERLSGAFKVILEQSDKQVKDEGDVVDFVFEEGAVYGFKECILGVFTIRYKFDGCIGEAVFEEI